MLPDKCSVLEHNRHCPNPPEFVMSVLTESGEYMVGVTCRRHREHVSEKLSALQKQGRIPAGTISFSELKAVGTDCIRGDPDDLIHL